MAVAVLDDNRSVHAVATGYGCTWNIYHDAVIAAADPVLAGEPAPVSVLGIDETWHGKAKGRSARRAGAGGGRTASTPAWSTSQARPDCWCRSTAARRHRSSTGSPSVMRHGSFVAIDMSLTYARLNDRTDGRRAIIAATTVSD